MQEGENNIGKFAEGSGSAQDQISRENQQLNMPGVVQSGSSSPNVGDIAAEGPPLSPADKKRNKLGYHRTAVACGHCRRRKIRCIPAFEDPSGRCQNCIRLKKDCQFFPVDQQNSAPGKRVRSSMKTAESFLNEGDVSVASSPGGILRSTSMEQISHAEGSLDTPPCPEKVQDIMECTRPDPWFDFAPSYDPRQHHHQNQQIIVQSPYSLRGYAADSMNSQIYQLQYGQSLPTQYSSTFSAGSLPPTVTTLAQEQTFEYQASAPNGAYNWGQPARSMSSDESEELSSGFPTPYRTNTYPSFEGRMTGQIQQLPRTSSSLMPMSIEGQQNSTHSGFREPDSYQPLQIGMQHNWGRGNPDSAQQLSASGAGTYSQGWYRPHPTLTDMQQEEGQTQMLLSQSQNSRRNQHKPG